MSFLYNVIIALLYLGALLASPFYPKAKKLITGRKKMFKKLQNEINSSDRVLWFHAASVGEFEQGRPVIEEIRKLYPQYKILLTFFSPSGFEANKNYSQANYIYYLPFDFSWNARKFYNIVKPHAIFFIKYEFWYNFIHQAYKNNIPLYCISAIFRPDHFFFKWYGKPYRKILNEFNFIFVQNNTSKELLNLHGIQHTAVCGDTRFDRVVQIAKQIKTLPLIETFAKDSKIIIAGSTWPADEKVLFQYFQDHLSNNLKTKLIIVPHEVDNEYHLESLTLSFNGNAIRYSKLNNNSNIEKYKVLIIDVIGILSSAYRFGYIAYIGGGFGKGIHNILEAATYGIPVIFGPKYKKFQEALDLTYRKGAFPINNYSDLEKILNNLLSNNQLYQNACEICKKYVNENIGSTKKILQHIEPILKS